MSRIIIRAKMFTEQYNVYTANHPNRMALYATKL